MGPVRLDMSRDECKRCLRCLELDAYGNMVSVLRAQGSFTTEKQKLLQELAKVLHISNERHRAEIRRAVNDEQLTAIAEQLSGPNTGTDWAIEGRRIIPLIPRLKSRTAFTKLANNLSLVTAIANEKKPILQDQTSDLKGKIEFQEELRMKDSSSTSTTFVQSENCMNTRKRRRSLIETELEQNVHQLANVQNNSTQPVVTSVPSEEGKTAPSLPVPNKVLILPFSSVSEGIKQPIIDKSCLGNLKQVPCSGSTVSYQQNVTLVPLGVSCTGSNSTVVCKSVTSQATIYSQSLIQSTHSGIGPLPTFITTSTKSRSQVLTTQEKINPKIISLTVAPNTTQIERSTLPLEIQDGQTRDGGVTQVMNTNLCSTSNGPGPPQTKIMTTVTCKKMSPTKINYENISKMGVSLYSNKSLNLAPVPNARLTTKTNVIVVQKGPARGVTLSHAGKEVLGKVIMGGKSLCLSNQPSTNTIALLPHRSIINGDQNVTFSTVGTPELSKSNAKTSNVFVFGLRQDVLEKSKVLSQFLEASGVLSSDSKAALLNPNMHLLMKDENSGTMQTVSKNLHLTDKASISEIRGQRDHEEVSETLNTQELETSSMITSTDIKETSLISQINEESQGTLDPQTGIYSFQSSDGDKSDLPSMSSSQSTGIDDFSTILTHRNTHLKNPQRGNISEEVNVIEKIRNAILNNDQFSKFNNQLNSTTNQ
ncbi:BRCA2-interacting transcriptional repressor EMSY isoform X2 [Orussus abietinus]|uniref:BRCA2-interacting transcriptional repressor EMSY isoform X2 n=1 Tax=Orussus abietinus TaxID=222816 RepID=UPI0006253E92|nr:BRCA2-interacting transcriptional repressor EMSY isoform X2 [Orussus abietinus]